MPLDGLQPGLEELNRRIAGVLAVRPKSITIEFYYMPALARISWSKRAGGAVVLGCTTPQSSEPVPVVILIDKAWRNALVHELCHVYQPDASERAIRTQTKSVIRYLKMREWPSPEQGALL